MKLGPDEAAPVAAYVLNTVQTCCLAASGAPNSGKLRLFRVVASATGPRLASAEVTTPYCTLRSTKREFHLAHLPLLAGRAVPSQYAATERVLRRLAAAFRRHRVDLVLALRCIATYALPKLDFLHGASPPRRLPCLRIQRLVDNAVRALLQLPASCPVRWLRAAPEHGGLGVPDVWIRAHLHLLRQFYDALGSRNRLISSNLRHMWVHCGDLPHQPADSAPIRSALQLVRGRLSLPPHPLLVPVVPDIIRLRPWTGQRVLLISDGSYLVSSMSWAAGVADADGALAFASASVLCAGSHSTAAEWLGRAQAVLLARELGIPLRAGLSFPSDWNAQQLGRFP